MNVMPESPMAAASGRSRYRARHRRNILCVFPEYAPSFGTFQHAYKLMPGVRGFMPPQGLLLIAAYMPAEWDVRFIDENMGPAGAADFAWADAVFISGMHVQRPFIDGINRRAQRAGKLTVLGGPSVSACPEYYPDVDLLHLGELGDATDAILAYIDDRPVRPPGQIIFHTEDRVALDAFPEPAYDQVDVSKYFLGSVQFSSGCPYRCEFCDIPALYGRNPRLKTPEQISRELDAIVANGAKGAVYFVDDNFVGNKKAAHELLPHLIRWQKEKGYPLRFACEATMNMAQMPDLLGMMREANFHTVFVGIETPETEALAQMDKKQNLRLPILEGVDILNSFGMEVVSGIIMGLDTDTPQTGRNILQFIEASNIPLLTINLLYALPKTPLFDRLKREGRLLPEAVAARRASNVDFLMPYDDVMAMWYDTITRAYTPEALLKRFEHQTKTTFRNRIGKRPKSSWAMVSYGLQIVGRTLWHAGVASEWRNEFWKLCGPLLRQGRIEDVVHIGIVASHLLTFVDDIKRGRHEAAFYADTNLKREPARVPAVSEAA
jgi:hopanoid C-2 methylase